MTTTREATVINRANGNPVLDMDPVMIEMADAEFANPRCGKLMDVWDAMIEAEGNEEDLVLGLVWSDTMLSASVQAVCPVCDDIFRVDDEMAVEDMADGSCAMVCCECLD